jgi:hypothetical protein
MSSPPITSTQPHAHSAPPTIDNEIFISYSRRDQQFVRALDTAFRQLNRNPWVDWDDIHKGEKWWEAIQQGIEAANTFIFVVTPDSLSSSICRDEIDYAVKHNKRILPILRREGFDPEKLHPAIASHNWLFFRETDDFESAFQELLEAIDTDLDYVRTHTRLLVRAIEWQNKAYPPGGLLRGADLEEAEEWLSKSVNKTPEPTSLQNDYIHTSRQAEAAKLKARQKAKWIIGLTTIVVNMLLVFGGCSWFYNYVTEQTWQRVQDNLRSAFKAGLLGIDGDDFAELAELGSEANPPIDSELYQEHQAWLNTVHDAFPSAYLRTYIPGDDESEILWIGDNSRAEQMLSIQRLADSPTQFKSAYSLRYETAQPLDITTQALQADGNPFEITITQPYEDDLGQWVSAYGGPIRDSDGEVVGGLRVDFKEDYVERVQQEARQGLIAVYVISFVWLIILSLIILRVTRPVEELSTQRKRLANRRSAT